MIRFPTEDTERKNRREHRGNNSPYCINSIANWYNPLCKSRAVKFSFPSQEGNFLIKLKEINCPALQKGENTVFKKSGFSEKPDFSENFIPGNLC